MQYSTIVASVLALAITGTNAAAVKKQALTGSVDAYNNSECLSEAHETFELAVDECVTFEQGYGAVTGTVEGAQEGEYLGK